MIVDKMSYGQVAREIDKAKERVDKWFAHNSSHIHHRFKKSKKRHLEYMLPVGSPRPDCAVTIFNAGKAYGISILIWKESPHGKHFYTCDDDGKRFTYIEFTPHFVARYIERLGLDCTPTEAMLRYLESRVEFNSMDVVTGNSPTEKLNQSVRGVMTYTKTREGVAVVDQVDNYHVYCTFLTDDMGLRDEKEVISFVVDEFNHYEYKPQRTSPFTPQSRPGIVKRAEEVEKKYGAGLTRVFDRQFSPEPGKESEND